MSMNPQNLGSIPAETVRIARAACPKGTLAMRLREVLGDLYQDEQFVKLDPVEALRPCGGMWQKIHAIFPSKMRKRRCCRLR